MNPENTLKGRMAETLVEELLKKSGNTVYRFGYEAIVQNLVQLENTFDKNSDVGQRIRAIPDFIVIDKDGKPVFVEVKFRWDSKLHENDYKLLDTIKKFWCARVIFVNCSEQPYFRICDPPYYGMIRKTLLAEPLINETSWRVNKKVYEEYEELVYRYLTPARIPPRR